MVNDSELFSGISHVAVLFAHGSRAIEALDIVTKYTKRRNGSDILLLFWYTSNANLTMPAI